MKKAEAAKTAATTVAATTTTAAPQESTIEPRSLPTNVMDFQADAGKGTEGMDKDSIAIPFLLVLQPLSPQIEKVEGAKAGKFCNSVTNDLYDAPILVPVGFQRRWLRWGARAAGGGFKGEMTTSQVNELRNAGKIVELEGRLYVPEQDGSVNPDKSDRVADTRSHFVLALRDEADDLPIAMVFALTSTGIKISKNFAAKIDGVRMRGADNKPFNPPSFSHMYKATAIQKENARGRWWLPQIEMVGPLKPTQTSIYAAAKALHAQVGSGAVTVAHDSVGDIDDAPASSGTGNDTDQRV
jgi:hypothetical protein